MKFKPNLSERNEGRWQSLVTAAAQIIWIADGKGNIIDDIPTWREFTGQRLEEVKGRGWLNALHPEDRERTAAVWSHALNTRLPYATEYRVRRHDGEYRHLVARGVPVYKSDG